MSKYKERDIEQLDIDGGYYSSHIDSMTAEGLHGKSDIAAELAHRDYRLDEAHNLIEALHASGCLDFEREQLAQKWLTA